MSNPAVPEKGAVTTANPPGHPDDPTSAVLQTVTADPPAATADPPAATADPPAATADPPTGLGSIPTDLGRGMPGRHGLTQLAGGFALMVAGGALVIMRRPRRGLKRR